MSDSYKQWMFSAGEIGVQLGTHEMPEDKNQIITLGLFNADSRDILRLIMTVNAYREAGYQRLALFMPYVPYGRQDRVTTPGTAFSLKAFAQIINSLDFIAVAVVDPHSPVTVELIDRCKVFTQAEIIARHLAYFSQPDLAEGDTSMFAILIQTWGAEEPWVVVAPDKGAVGRAQAMAKVLGTDEVFYAEKVRDPATGEITGLTLSGDVTNRCVVVVDDICDGGYTFIKLAEHLENTAFRMLLVTHGIFSKGFMTVAEHYDAVFCFDTFDRSIVDLPNDEVDEIPANNLIHFSVVPEEPTAAEDPELTDSPVTE